MGYNNDKEVVFAFLRRVDYNKGWKEIESDLLYDFGDFNFGKGHTPELRNKITETIKYLKIQFEDVFDEDGDTKEKY